MCANVHVTGTCTMYMYMYVIRGETLWVRLQEGLQYKYLIKEEGNHTINCMEFPLQMNNTVQ